MANKSLFKKRKKLIKKRYYFLLILIMLTSILVFYHYPNQSYFEIPKFSESFYLIPDEKGGEKVINQDKKGLQLSTPPDDIFEITKDPSLKFSIQIYTSDNYEDIKNMMKSMLNSVDTIFSSEDLYTAVLKHNFGNEFFLLYKNFNLRNEALSHCNKYGFFLENCIIVNVQNLE